MVHDIVKIKEKNEILGLLKQFSPYLYEPFDERKIDLELYAEKLSEKALVYVTYLAGEAVGIICFYCNDKKRKEGYLTLLAVKTSYRKCGIATELLKLLESQCKRENMKKIKLEVNRKNEQAINLYKNLGWQNTVGEITGVNYMVKYID